MIPPASLINPPKPNGDHILPSVYRQSNATVANHESDSSGFPIAWPPLENNSSRVRRVSTLPYNNINRDSLDLSRQKPSRWLVLVLPPALLIQESRNLGQTLASGPKNRLSQGILMPLFPTMYGQLTAIAREFNFPSINGLCLYMHITEGSNLFLPRISDESWSILWSNLFEGNAPTSHSPLPISGRIEFDIDLARALWYASWVSAPQREPVSFPSAPNSHNQQDSIASMTGDEKHATAARQESKVPVPPRHVPRKLSLVNKLPTRSGLHVRADSHPLSPMTHEEEALVDKLETSAKSWRAGAPLDPVPLTVFGQTCLEPANVPKTLQLDSSIDEHVQPRSELNLDDYSWSISSAGPSKLNSPVSWTRVPSVHLDKRVEGSVSLPPSTYTSLGSQDSAISSIARSPSHDIATRMSEETSPTVSVVTSWGPPSSYPPSPPSVYRAPSLDLGERCGWSRPVTPSTATSWGPPDFSLPTSATSSRVGTPDAAQIAFDFDKEIATQPSPWSFCWPVYKPHIDLPSQRSLIKTSVYPLLVIYPTAYPHFDIYPAIKPRSSTFEKIPMSPRPDYPVFSKTSIYPLVVVYPPVYPHFDIYPAVRPRTSTFEKTSMSPRPGYPIFSETSVYPLLIIYPSVYPHFDIYPAVGPKSSTFKKTPTNPHPGYPVFSETSVYPLLVIYPTAYPHFDIYPAVGPQSSTFKKTPTNPHPGYPVFSGTSVYPLLVIYPTAYPHFDIYPAVGPKSNSFKKTPTNRHPGYPVFSKTSVYPLLVIYPTAYPHFDIYPAIKPRSSTFEKIPMSPRPDYPVFSKTSIYPLVVVYPPVYPHFDIYPAVGPKNSTFEKPPTSPHSGYPMLDIYPKALDSKTGSHTEVGHLVEYGKIKSDARYPVIDIYPPVYPYFKIYPSVSRFLTEIPSRTPTHDVTFFGLFLNIVESEYGARRILKTRFGTQHSESVEEHKSLDLSVRFRPIYPTIEIYQSTYPYLVIYPVISDQSNKVVHSPHSYKSLPARLQVQYPYLQIYPVVYPAFEIYPISERLYDLPASNDVQTQGARRLQMPSLSSSHSIMRGPQGEDIPPVPRLPRNAKTMKPISPITHLPLPNERLKPNFSTCYPDSEKHHAVSASRISPALIHDSYRKMRSVRLEFYPHLVIYHVTYPNFDIFPSVAGSMEVKLVDIGPSTLKKPLTQCSGTDPFTYPLPEKHKPTYPNFDLYPSRSSDSRQQSSLVSDNARDLVRQETGHSFHAKDVGNGFAQFSTTSSRRRSQRTHESLHREVFGPSGHLTGPRPTSSVPASSPRLGTFGNNSSLKNGICRELRSEAETSLQIPSITINGVTVMHKVSPREDLPNEVDSSRARSIAIPPGFLWQDNERPRDRAPSYSEGLPTSLDSALSMFPVPPKNLQLKLRP